jgi:hypothetical protein
MNNTLSQLKDLATAAWSADDGQSTVQDIAASVVRRAVRDGLVLPELGDAARSVVVAYLRTQPAAAARPAAPAKPAPKVSEVPPAKQAAVDAACAEIVALGGTPKVVVLRHDRGVLVTSDLGYAENKVRWTDEYGPQWAGYSGGHKTAAAALADSLASQAKVEAAEAARAALVAKLDADAAAARAPIDLGARLAALARAGHPVLSLHSAGIFAANTLVARRHVTYAASSSQVDGKDYAAWGVRDDAVVDGEYHVAEPDATEVLAAAGVAL